MNEQKVLNKVTNCHVCGKTLGTDRYIMSPNGGICRNKAWCPDCYELAQKAATKQSVEHYAARTTAAWDDGMGRRHRG